VGLTGRRWRGEAAAVCRRLVGLVPAARVVQLSSTDSRLELPPPLKLASYPPPLRPASEPARPTLSLSPSFPLVIFSFPTVVPIVVLALLVLIIAS
jgi:hypothetical protein